MDVHALRHTKATWMAMARVPVRKAQEEMRHSTITLTMKVYTDVRLLDDGEAVAALPSLAPGSSKSVMLTIREATR